MRISTLFEGRSAAKEMKLIQLKSDLNYIIGLSASQDQVDAVDDLQVKIRDLAKEIQLDRKGD